MCASTEIFAVRIADLWRALSKRHTNTAAQPVQGILFVKLLRSPVPAPFVRQRNLDLCPQLFGHRLTISEHPLLNDRSYSSLDSDCETGMLLVVPVNMKKFLILYLYSRLAVRSCNDTSVIWTGCATMPTE